MADKKEKRDLTGVTGDGCGKHGHLRRSCPTKWDEKSTTQGKASSAKKPPSGTLYTAVAHTTVPAKEGLTNCFYIDLGASDHLVPSKGDLRADRVFEQLVEIAVANSG